MTLSPSIQRRRKNIAFSALPKPQGAQRGEGPKICLLNFSVCVSIRVLQVYNKLKHISRRAWSSSSSSTRAVVRLQCRQTPMASKAEEDVLRAFKREVMEQRAIIIEALSEVSAFGETYLY